MRRTPPTPDDPAEPACPPFPDAPPEPPRAAPPLPARPPEPAVPPAPAPPEPAPPLADVPPAPDEPPVPVTPPAPDDPAPPKAPPPPAAGTARVRCAARAGLSANRSAGSRLTSARAGSITTSAAATDNRRHRETPEGNDNDASSDARPISLRPLGHTHERFLGVHLTQSAHCRSDSAAVALHGRHDGRHRTTAAATGFL